MNQQFIFLHLKSNLLHLYEERELNNISKILWEDLFSKDSSKSLELKLEVITSRLSNAEPLQYILGEADFYGLKIKVNPAVLIPRPETEELVHFCIQKEQSLGADFIDIGTGSGCIPIALAKNLNREFSFHAIDVSKEAIKLARENSSAEGLKITFESLDFTNKEEWKKLGMFDVIISNPPYIAIDEENKLSRSVLEFEPKLALFSPTTDALLFYRLIHIFSFNHLKKGGRIYLELNEFNALDAKKVFAEFGYTDLSIIKDMQGKERILYGLKTMS